MKKDLRIRPVYIAALFFLFSLIFVIEALTSEHMAYFFDFVGYGGTFRYSDLSILGISAYWLLMLGGLVICMFISLAQRDRYGYSTKKALLIPPVFLLVCLLGAKLLYIAENFEAVKAHGISLDGLSLFGAIFLVIPAAFAAGGFKRSEAAKLLDFCAPLGLTLLVCVRSGCFITGCCGAVTIWDGANPIILPIQLFEVTLDLLILEGCRYTENKYPLKGLSYAVLLIGYGTVRFFLEFLRKPLNGGGQIFFSNGRIFALVSIALGLLLGTVFYLMSEKKKENDKKEP